MKLTILIVALFLTPLLNAYSDLEIYQNVLNEELGGFSFLIDGFVVDNDGILSITLSATYFLILFLLPVAVGFLIFFVGSKRYAKYNFPIASLGTFVVLLILSLGLLGENPIIQKKYENKIAQKYKIDKPISVFFNLEK